MPIYEYRCESCAHELEALQKVSDDALIVCPECGQPALKKMLSAAGFRLKGGGWYETDFKAGAKKNLHGETDKRKDSSSPEDTGKKQDGSKKKASNAAANGAGGSPS